MKILIVKSSSFGDIVHTFPVLELLKAEGLFPEPVLIDWVVEQRCLPLVATHPKVNRPLVINTSAWKRAFYSRATCQAVIEAFRALRAEQYDAVIDLKGTCKSACCTWLARAPNKVGFALRSLPEWPNLLATNRRFNPVHGLPIRHHYLDLVVRWLNSLQIYPSQVAIEKALTAACSFILSKEESLRLAALVQQYKLKDRPTILFCPYSAWQSKQIPMHLLSELLGRLNAEGFQTAVIAGSEREKEAFYQLKLPSTLLFDRLSLPLLQQVMQQVSLVVATDSLPLHLAATTTTPILSLFGPTSSDIYGPMRSDCHTFQGSCPYGLSFVKRCSRVRSCPAPCMEMTKADTLLSVIRTVVSSGHLTNFRQK